MKPRDYCCCAIPLVNAGVYATLTEQFIASIIAGTLSVATPSIVGAATPSFAPLLFAIFCYVAAAIQIMGFFGVAQEKETMFRRYSTLNTGATIAVFAIAAAWVIISGSRHSTAQSKCEATFFPSSSSNGSTSSEGSTACDIFAWVDVGLMAGIWVFFALVQGYLLFVVSSYSATQRQDHEKYEALNDSSRAMADNIPMADRSDPWDSRASYDPYGDGSRGHTRQESTAQKEGYNTYSSRGAESQYTDNQFVGQARPDGY